VAGGEGSSTAGGGGSSAAGGVGIFRDWRRETSAATGATPRQVVEGECEARHGGGVRRRVGPRVTGVR
jgi:hypothetical protein